MKGIRTTERRSIEDCYNTNTFSAYENYFFYDSLGSQGRLVNMFNSNIVNVLNDLIDNNSCLQVYTVFLVMNQG